MTNAAPTPPAAPTPAELDVDANEDLKKAVNGALENNTPMIIAYVDEAGQPSLSFRGSTQVYSPKQLAVWVRNPEGGLLRSLEKNPHVTFMYRDGATRST